MSPPQTARQLVFQEGGSQKFWNIELDGASHVVWFGRIGTQGQRQSKEFSSAAEAKTSYDKLVAEKVKKGYVDAGGGSGAAPATAPPAAKTKSAAAAAPAAGATKPAAKTKAVGKGKAASPAADDETADDPAAPTAAASPAPSVAAAPSPPPAPLDLNLPRSIDLAPEDWRRATFRKLPPLIRGEAKPFDPAACVERMANLRTTDYGWRFRWEDLHLTPALSPAEARFWLEAICTPRARNSDGKAISKKLAKQKFDAPLSDKELDELLHQIGREPPPEAILPLFALRPADEVLRIVFGLPATGAKTRRGEESRSLADGFVRFGVPWLSEAERAACVKEVRGEWDPAKASSNPHEILPVAFPLAAGLGMHDETLQLVSTWSDDRYSKTSYASHYQQPQDILFGLGSAALVESHWRRMDLPFHDAEQVRAFLACTEYSALDLVKKAVLAQTNKDECDAFLKALALVHAPEAVEPMLECMLAAKAPAAARDWLEKNTAFVLPVLIRTAGGRGKLADAALDRLRDEQRLGRSEAIREALAQQPDAAVAEKIRREVLDAAEQTLEPLDAASTPAWLQAALDAVASPKAKPPKLPGWAAPALLPPLPVEGRKLSDDQVAAVLAQLVAAPLGTPGPLLSALREHVDRRARDAFTWKLFQSWSADGAPNKEKWAFGSIGHLGGDGAALKLTPLVRNWPGESQHARAVFGLECLRAIGSDVALMQLSGIAQKLKFKGLKSKAEEFVTAIAEERGMSRAELEDRVVPDCGLDEHGRREFSFGPRSFSFVLGAGLKAMVRDADGKIREDLPKPSSKDDAALAEESVAEWKLMKKQIKEVASIQASRLEQAMVVGRRWRVEDFEVLVVRQPLMTHLARQLLWEAFDTSGKRIAIFRVTDERDYADSEDSPVSLAEAAAVGVAHPLSLSEEERAAWGQVFGDYEIVSPFPQLGRAVYTLEPGEAGLTELTRFKGTKLVAPTLVFTLEKLGWIRGEAMDAGCFDEHSKQFPAADVTAVVGYDGTVGMGYIDPNETLTLENCCFVTGMRKPSGYGWKKEKLKKLGDVSPVVLSEVLADLHLLKTKGK